MSTRPRIDVSILIVSYNTRELTLAALDSIVAETKDVSYEIIVVDNASHDGSAEAIARHHAKPRLIALNDNIGFARGNNMAAEYASGDFILLINPDTEVTDAAIDRLVKFAREQWRALIWGGRTLFPDRSLNPSSCWQHMTAWNMLCGATGLNSIFSNSEWLNGEPYGGWKRDSIREVDIVSGCFLLIPRHIWHALGGFDPLYFMYGEEADLCLRAKRLGARPMIYPEATIIHHGGASELHRTSKALKLLLAKATLIRRHWHPLLRPIGLTLLAARPLTRAIVYSLAAAVTGSQHLNETAEVWRQTWSIRRDWIGGYTSRPSEPDPMPKETPQFHTLRAAR